MTTFVLIMYLSGHVYQLPMPSMEACRDFLAKKMDTVERPPFIYCKSVDPLETPPNTDKLRSLIIREPYRDVDEGYAWRASPFF
jgi:hypothetical protein